jgi:glutaredoxin-related protein
MEGFDSTANEGWCVIYFKGLPPFPKPDFCNNAVDIEGAVKDPSLCT